MLQCSFHIKFTKLKKEGVFSQPHRTFWGSTLYLLLMCLEMDRVGAERPSSVLNWNVRTCLCQTYIFSPVLLLLLRWSFSKANWFFWLWIDLSHFLAPLAHWPHARPTPPPALWAHIHYMGITQYSMESLESCPSNAQQGKLSWILAPWRQGQNDGKAWR